MEYTVTKTKINLLNYGIAADLASKLVSHGLNVTKIRALPIGDLVKNYGITESDAKHVKDCIVRDPIDDNTIQLLLRASNFTCCVCKIQKNGFIIHHIEEYHLTQNNSESNLAVLCPICHDTAHRKGIGLTQTLSKEQIVSEKESWEKNVIENNKLTALNKFAINENNVDYINFKRIDDLATALYSEIPPTTYKRAMIDSGILDINGRFNVSKFENDPDRYRNYFHRTNSGEGVYYTDLLREIGKKAQFITLNGNLNVKKIKNIEANSLISFTFALIGKRFNKPTLLNIENSTLRYKKLKTIIEVNISSEYIVSTSANVRLGKKCIYSVYGRLSYHNKDENGNTIIGVSPLLIALPTKYFDDELDSEWFEKELITIDNMPF